MKTTNESFTGSDWNLQYSWASLGIACWLVFWSCPLICEGATLGWNGPAAPAVGIFDQAANWLPAGGPPGMADNATFGLAAPVPAGAVVSFRQNEQSASLRIDSAFAGAAGGFAFNLGVNTYTITNLTKLQGAGILDLNGMGRLVTNDLELEPAAQLNINGGTDVMVRNQATVAGRLNVNAAGARFRLVDPAALAAVRMLTVTGTIDIAAGVAETDNAVHDVNGLVDVHLGGVFETNGRGVFSGVRVRDPGSRWTHTNNGILEVNTLDVLNGGRVETRGTGNIEHFFTATVNGNGSSWTENIGNFQNNGDLHVTNTGNATFNNGPFFNNSHPAGFATVLVDQAGTMNTETIINAGAFVVEDLGSSITATGQILNLAGAAFSVDNVATASAVFLDNSGSFDVSAGGIALFDSGVNQMGGFMDASGGLLGFVGNLDNNAGATIRIRGGGVVAAGSLNNGGRLLIGNSPDVALIDGDFTQNSSGSVEIELFGLGDVAGTDFDFLEITGTGNIGGLLDVVPIVDIPMGSTFDIVVADDLQISNPTIYSGWQLTSNGQVLQIEALQFIPKVPEPSNFALLGLGAICLLRRFRRAA